MAPMPNLAPREILIGTSLHVLPTNLRVNSSVILSSTKCKYLKSSSSILRISGERANDTNKGLGGGRMLPAALPLLQ
jgi:hypothetical protein